MKNNIYRVLFTSALITATVSPTLLSTTSVLAQEADSVHSDTKLVLTDIEEGNSDVTQNILSGITLESSENQDLIISGNVDSSLYQLEVSASETPIEINKESDFELTVSSTINSNLTISILDANNKEILDEMVLDVDDVIEELRSLTGEAKIIEEKESIDLNEGIYKSIDEELNDTTPSLERSSEVEELLNGEGSNSQPLEDSSVTTSSSTRTHVNGVYTVVKGDVFNDIAKSFNITPLQLRQWNGQITDVNLLLVGQKIGVTKQGAEAMLSTAEKARLHTEDNPSLFDGVDEFLEELAPTAIEVSNQQGKEALYPSLMLAQAIHESGVARTIGMSQLSRPPYYNLSGIKANGHPDYVLMWTWEYINNENVDVLAEFRTFDSYESSLNRYADLLRNGNSIAIDYYKGTWRSNTQDVFEVLDEGGLRGYATDPNYFASIRNIIEEYDLTKYDSVDRIEGDTRFDTAVAVSQEGWTESNTVIITDGYQYADALAGAPLAAELDAPILMTKSTGLDQATTNEIKRLGASNAIILGGEVAVSSKVLTELKNLGLSTERIAGSDRYETAGLIADRVIALTGSTEAIMVSGQDFADAMSVAPFAAREGVPIYLTKSKTLADEVLEASERIKYWTIVGGSTAVTGTVGRALLKNVTTVERIQGDNRYHTNQRVISYYGVEGSELYIATGEDFADALTGSVLAAKQNSAVMLVRNHEHYINSQINYSITNNFNHFTLLGGETALPNRIAESFQVLRVVD